MKKFEEEMGENERGFTKEHLDITFCAFLLVFVFSGLSALLVGIPLLSDEIIAYIANNVITFMDKIGLDKVIDNSLFVAKGWVSTWIITSLTIAALLKVIINMFIRSLSSSYRIVFVLLSVAQIIFVIKKIFSKGLFWDNCQFGL